MDWLAYDKRILFYHYLVKENIKIINFGIMIGYHFRALFYIWSFSPELLSV